MFFFCVRLGTTRVPVAQGGQKRAADFPDQELQAVVSCHLGAGPGSSGRVAGAHNQGAISPAPDT